MSAKAAPKCPYRQSKPLTDSMRQHCHIYFDEKLYVNALNLLANILTTGTSQPNQLSSPAFAPLPFHIELVSTLLIHPRHTNQADPDEHPDLSSRCITFLRNVLAILGPVNANLCNAFSYTHTHNTRSMRRARLVGGPPDSEDNPERMNGVIANGGRLKRCAQDFWHMVGWAFNCSVRYPRRWQYLKVWLDYMLDVLDADWDERERQDRAAWDVDRPHEKKDYKWLQESLLVAYVSDAQGRSAAVRRIIRSVFADGQPHSLKEFPEVFPKETQKGKRLGGQKSKTQDLTSPRFGNFDYDTDSNDEFGVNEHEHSLEEDEGSDFGWMGGTESMILRQRVLCLLCRIADFFPDRFTTCNELYYDLCSPVLSLPVPYFAIFFSASSPLCKMVPGVYISLSQMLLQQLLPASAPSLHPSLRHRHSNDVISQSIFTKSYLPFPAHTKLPADHAMLSLLLENLFRLFLKTPGRLVWSTALANALETGVRARELAVIHGRPLPRRKQSRHDRIDAGADVDEDASWLRASGARLRSLLVWLKHDGTALAEK